MFLFAASCLLTSIASFLFGFFVIYKNFRAKLNRSWFFASVAIGTWSFGLWGVVSAGSAHEAMFYQYILDIGAIFIPICYFLFSLRLLKIYEEKRVVAKSSIAIGLFLAALSFSPYFKQGMVQQHGFNYWVKPGALYIIFPVIFSLFMLYAFFLLIRNYQKAVGIEKSQIIYVLSAGVVGFIGGATDFFPQLINIYPIGNYFVIFYVGLVAYAIVRYRLMSIKLIVSKIYFYFVIGGFAYLSFHVVIFVNNSFMGGLYTPRALLVGVLFSVLFSVSFLPLLERAQKSSDALFFRGYNPRTIIKDLTIRLSTVIDFVQLIDTLASEFKKILEVEELDVLLFPQNSHEGGFCITGGRSYKDVELCTSGAICKKIISDRQIIVRDELSDAAMDDLMKELDDNKIKIVSPLAIHDKVIGLILLGNKISQDAYGQEDIEFLEIISSQAAVAVENARLHHEVEDFNKNLQLKVDEQTAQIKEQVERLQKLIAIRSEFLDIASHQLRTPVSVIKGVLSMLHDGSLPPERQSEFIDSAFQKSLKLNDIIDEILQASEMDSDNFVLTLEPTSLESLLNEIYSDKMMSAGQRGIDLKIYLPSIGLLPKVMTETRYLRHVITNMVNNSLQYTPSGGTITLSAGEEGGYVVIRVADNGIGIPSEDMPKIFKKFSRAKNAVSTYTDGSGLGMYICKKIIDGHPGASIEIEKTEVDHGTTIAVKLPAIK